MPEEQENPIERREPGGGIGRRSDIAQRGMNAANYVSGLAARQGADLQKTPPEYTYEFLRKWGGTRNARDGQFHSPLNLAIDGDGNVYVLDRYNHRIQVFDSQGRFLRKWGTRGVGDGQFHNPHGIAIDGEGRVYTADMGNRRIQERIQVFDSQGRFMRKWGTHGFGDGEFIGARMIALDGDGRVYVTDHQSGRIQVFDSEGRFLRKWGTQEGDEFISISGIALDGDGKVYVADCLNRRIQVFDPQGQLLRKWSAGREEWPWKFRAPMGIALDGDGRVYVTDWKSGIKVSDNQGKFLFAWGALGDEDGQFREPTGLSLDAGGIVYVADTRNNRIQVFRRVS